MEDNLTTLFQELLDKGLIEVARINPHFTVSLASSKPYILSVWELDYFKKEKWRWN